MPERMVITAEYEIVTPMFIGDADQKATTISPAAVKGALRFWWRALNWGEVRKTTENDSEALCELHRKERHLFGQTAKFEKEKQVGGQGKFLLRVDPRKLQFKSSQDLDQDDTYSLDSGAWQTYLLGLGLMEYKDRRNQYTRSAIVSGMFSVKLYCRDKKNLDEIKPVLLLWGLLGGLGSRSRKGLGSVSIKALDGEDIPRDREQLIECLKIIIGEEHLSDTLPPYTAFSKSTRIQLSNESELSPWGSLGRIGLTMQPFRGWGFEKNGCHYIKGNIKASHGSHSVKQQDHDWIYAFAEKGSSAPDQYPKSAVFGLPRMYGLSHCGPSKNQRKEVEMTPKPYKADGKPDKDGKRSRRASPLFIHIHKLENGNTVTIQSFLPATFLPVTDKICLKERKGPGEKNVSPDRPTDWTVINEYLSLGDFKRWEDVL